MTECNQLGFELPGFSGRKIDGNFWGGNLSSDGGLMLLRQVDRFMGLTKELARRLPDRRDPDKIEHSLESMLRQRIYGLALGYEDTLSAKMQKRAERKHRRSGLKVRLFSQFQYKAKTWDKKRRVIAKAEYTNGPVLRWEPSV